MKGVNIFCSILIASLLTVSLSFYGCDSSETNYGTVSLSFRPPIIDKIADDTIVLDTVKILLQNIKVKHQAGDLEDNIHLGTMVVHLNTNEMTTDFAVENVPAGEYDRIRFEVHKCGGSEIPPDPEFREGSDSSLRYSVIVKGNVNSNYFVYKSTKSAHQELLLEKPIIVEENTDVNLTITVDPLSWFYNGNTFLNPEDPANENDIDNNIVQSFKECFKDNNYDGIAD